MECNNNKDLKNYSYFYESYFNSWNYSYQNSEELEELALEKQFFLLAGIRIHLIYFMEHRNY